MKLVGLLPTSHLYPVINAAPDANVNLQEDKPLTLNMEFEMTRPMLDFLIRLHKNGDNPYDNEVTFPQCGNLTILLSLRFYVKSIFGGFRVSNSTILTIRAVPNFDFLGIFDIFKCEISQKSKLECFQN